MLPLCIYCADLVIYPAWYAEKSKPVRFIDAKYAHKMQTQTQVARCDSAFKAHRVTFNNKRRTMRRCYEIFCLKWHQSHKAQCFASLSLCWISQTRLRSFGLIVLCLILVYFCLIAHPPTRFFCPAQLSHSYSGTKDMRAHKLQQSQ